MTDIHSQNNNCITSTHQNMQNHPLTLSSPHHPSLPQNPTGKKSKKPRYPHRDVPLVDYNENHMGVSDNYVIRKGSEVRCKKATSGGEDTNPPPKKKSSLPATEGGSLPSSEDPSLPSQPSSLPSSSSTDDAHDAAVAVIGENNAEAEVEGEQIMQDEEEEEEEEEEGGGEVAGTTADLPAGFPQDVDILLDSKDVFEGTPLDRQQWYFVDYLEGGKHKTYLATPPLAGEEWEDMSRLHAYVLSLRDEVPLFSLLFGDTTPKRYTGDGLFRWSLYREEPADSLKDVYRKVLKTALKGTDKINQCVVNSGFTEDKFLKF